MSSGQNENAPFLKTIWFLVLPMFPRAQSHWVLAHHALKENFSLRWQKKVDKMKEKVLQNHLQSKVLREFISA